MWDYISKSVKAAFSSADRAAEGTRMQRERNVFAAVCPRTMGQLARGTRKDRALVPRSSSPVTVYVELPCILEQAISAIQWDDPGRCASAARGECDSTGSQVNESDADDQEFGLYGLDFLADSPATLESNLSPVELVPFQGCVIPPLTPQRYLSAEDGPTDSSAENGYPVAQDEVLWKGVSRCQGRALERSLEVNNQLHETLSRKQEELDSLQERNLHLRQLACRAKHLASVLEKLMNVSNASVGEPLPPCGDKPLSPCKRQRLDDGCVTEAADSVEDILRDVSTRCNAVLHGGASGATSRQGSDTIRMYGSFSGLQTTICKNGGAGEDGAEAEESVSSFRTSVREHGTIRTQVFPHGRAFTSSNPEGGYRFRWVPNDS